MRRSPAKAPRSRNVRRPIASSSATGGAAVAEIRAAITSLRRIRRFVGRWESSRVAQDVDTIRDVIASEIGSRDPATTVQLLKSLLDAHDAVFRHVDDSDGYVGGAFREVVDAWGRAWCDVPDRAPEEVAKIVLDAFDDNAYGMTDDVIATFSTALGSDGLTALRGSLERRFARLTPAERDDWERGGRTASGLANVADALGDVDAYISAHEMVDRRSLYAYEIAHRLLAADRAEEALAELDAAASDFRHQSERDDLRIACLEAMGAHEQAREHLRAVALRTLSADHLRRYCERLDEREREATRFAAIERARGSADALRGLVFLVEIEALDEAARFTIERATHFEGTNYTATGFVAKALAHAHPLAAIVLHRITALATLSKSVSKYYPHAVRDLRRAEQLASRVGDWQGVETQTDFLDRLRREHYLKTALWKLIDAPPSTARRR